MTRFGLLICATLLASCAETPTAPGNDPVAITTRTGGGFGGSQSTTIFPDDRVRVTTTGPSASDAVAREVGVPGAYARALAEASRLLPAAIAGAETQVCPDYGTDTVTIVPAIDGATGVSVSCPDDDVSALIRAINGSTSAAEPL